MAINNRSIIQMEPRARKLVRRFCKLAIIGGIFVGISAGEVLFDGGIQVHAKLLTAGAWPLLRPIPPKGGPVPVEWPEEEIGNEMMQSSKITQGVSSSDVNWIDLPKVKEDLVIGSLTKDYLIANFYAPSTNATYYVLIRRMDWGNVATAAWAKSEG